MLSPTAPLNHLPCDKGRFRERARENLKTSSGGFFAFLTLANCPLASPLPSYLHPVTCYKSWVERIVCLRKGTSWGLFLKQGPMLRTFPLHLPKNQSRREANEIIFFYGDYITNHALLLPPFQSCTLGTSDTSFREYTEFLEVKAGCGWCVLCSHLEMAPVQALQTHCFNCLRFPPLACFWEKDEARTCSPLSVYFSCLHISDGAAIHSGRPLPHQTSGQRGPACLCRPLPGS